MAWTGHGHHIPGSAIFISCIVDPEKKSCGGVDECEACIADVNEYHSYTSDEEKMARRAAEERSRGTIRTTLKKWMG